MTKEELLQRRENLLDTISSLKEKLSYAKQCASDYCGDTWGPHAQRAEGAISDIQYYTSMIEEKENQLNEIKRLLE